MEKDQEKAAKARESALKGALTQIERQFGQGSIMKMGDEAAAVRVSVIPTGALSLDLALGVGGVPRGRIVEVFGPESSGKTTLLYHVLASAQAMGGICAFIDAEHAMDPAYAKRIGVDIDELLVSQPDHGEQALEIADLLIRSGAVDVVAIDSVAALTPKAELEGQMGDQTVGVQARMMSQAMRKLAGNLNRANTLCVFTNQIREKVGVMFGCFTTTRAWCSPTGAPRRSARSSTSGCQLRSCQWIPRPARSRPSGSSSTTTTARPTSGSSSRSLPLAGRASGSSPARRTT